MALTRLGASTTPPVSDYSCLSQFSLVSFQVSKGDAAKKKNKAVKNEKKKTDSGKAARSKPIKVRPLLYRGAMIGTERPEHVLAPRHYFLFRCTRKKSEARTNVRMRRTPRWQLHLTQ